MNQKDKKVEFVKLTNYLKQLPSTKTTLVIMFLTAFITGILSSMAFLHSFEKLIITGVSVSVLFLWFPAMLDSLVTFSLSDFFKKRIDYKQSVYLSFFNMLIISFLVLVASALSFGDFTVILNVLIFSYVLVFVVRLFTFLLTQPFTLKKAAAIALTHPILGLLFIMLASDISAINTIFYFPALSAFHILIKTVFAFSILGSASLIFVIILNAPMLKNFGVSSFRLANAFLMHWFEKTLDIEKELEPMSEKARAFIGIIGFKAKKKLKAVVVIPYLHPGPFGEVGGAKMVGMLADKIEKDLGVKSIILHGTATHDLNPLRTSDISRIGREVTREVKEMKMNKGVSEAIVFKNNATITGQRIGNSVFLVSTFSPKPTEDIEFSIGLAAMNKLSKYYDNVLLADAHNCHFPGHHTIFSGDNRMYEYLDSVEQAGEALYKKKNSKSKVGVGIVKPAYSNEEGIGKAGVRALAIKAGTKTNCYIVFDSNNMKAGLRERVIKEVKNHSKAEVVEVMTTDSHCVNNIQGVDNPVGARISEEEVIRMSVKAVEKALQDLEECTAGAAMIHLDGVRVLGAQKATELVATVNSIVSVSKIAVPLIFLPAITIALLGMMLISF